MCTPIVLEITAPPMSCAVCGGLLWLFRVALRASHSHLVIVLSDIFGQCDIQKLIVSLSLGHARPSHKNIPHEAILLSHPLSSLPGLAVISICLFYKIFCTYCQWDQLGQGEHRCPIWKRLPLLWPFLQTLQGKWGQKDNRVLWNKFMYQGIDSREH